MVTTCAGALILAAGEILLGQRSPSLAFYPGAWDIFGGHVEPSESIEQALVRELWEELGITPLEFTLACVIQDQAAHPVPHDYHLYTVTRWSGTPENRAPEEHVEIRWLPLEEAARLQLAHPTYPELFRSLL